MKNKIVISTSILLLTTISTAIAGEDWKTYAGTSCQPDGNLFENSINTQYSAFGGVCNTSDKESLYIHCPIVRDMSKSFLPGIIKHAGRSGSSEKSLKCTLRNMKPEAASAGDMAGYYATLEPIKSESPIEGIKQVETDTFKYGSHDFGSHVITCELPPTDIRINDSKITSCLYNYSVLEFDGN